VSKVAMSITGVRQKLDGVEVVQFAMLLSTGEVVHVRYDVDNVYVVEANSPAVFERIGDDLFLLRGEGKDIIKKHPYLSPVRESVDVVGRGEGVIINANGFDYRVKNAPTVTLVTAFGRTTDSNDHVYSVVNAPVPDGFGDFVPIDEKKVEFKCIRTDRTYPDSYNSVVRELKAPSVSALISRLPKGTSVEVDDRDLVVPHYDDIQEFRSASVLGVKMGPMSWNDSIAGAMLTSSDVSRRVALINGYVNRDLIDKYCYVNGVYCNGAVVYNTRRDVPSIRFVHAGISFSTVPFRHNNLILTVCLDELPSKLRNLRGAAYCLPRVPPLITLYAAPVAPDIIPLPLGGDGLMMRICTLLRQGPADARTIAGILGVKVGEINKFLYSRMDIFSRVGSPLRWFLKSSAFIDRIEQTLTTFLLIPHSVSDLADLTGYDLTEIGYVLRSNPAKFIASGVPLKWQNVTGFEVPPVDL